MDISSLTIKKAHELLVQKEITARELAEHFLKEAQAKSDLNAYREIFDDVLASADVAQKMLDAGKGTFLTGIPLALKDNILIKGKIASASSKMLEHYRASYDANVTARLRDAPAHKSRELTWGRLGDRPGRGCVSVVPQCDEMRSLDISDPPGLDMFFLCVS